MLINSVIIILREVLEAALIVSVLLALCHNLHLSKKRFIASLLLGALLASLYAANLNSISDLFDGVGQEIVNTSLYLIIFTCLILLIIAIGKKPINTTLVLFAVSGCLAVALVREGSEVIIYIQGFTSSPNLFQSVLAGAFIGAGIGFSIGVFFYYLIVNLSPLNGVRLSLFILILICGGMISQATQLLIQADILASQAPLWNSEGWVSERSMIGQLLYALIGYESTPSPIQVAFYLISLAIASILAIMSLRTFQFNTTE